LASSLWPAIGSSMFSAIFTTNCCWPFPGNRNRSGWVVNLGLQKRDPTSPTKAKSPFARLIAVPIAI
jgi:hypothetical protein